MPLLSRLEHQNIAKQAASDGIAVASQTVATALASGEVKPEEFSVRHLAECLVEDGVEWVRSFDPHSGGGFIESGDAVSTANFSNITGQVVYSKILDAYNDPSFIGEELCTVVPTRFDGEKIPGMTRLGDGVDVVPEGRDYPLVGFSEEYVETPKTTKRGMIVPVTKEAIFFDRTNLILDRASEVGTWLGVNREKRILDTAFGITASYKYNGTAYSTYVDTPWDNLAASNALVDWTDIELAESLFDGMTDPGMGEPVIVSPDTIVVPTALLATARIILGGFVEKVDNQAEAVTYRTVAGTNPVKASTYRLVSSPYVKQRTGSASTWFVGNFKKAFAYMENWPITVVQAPTNSEDEFKRDIVAQYKASERGAAAVLNPRYAVKCTA